MTVSLSKFNPKSRADRRREKKPQKMLINGRFHYKGKRMGHPRMKRGVSGNPEGVRKKPGTSYRDKHPYKKTGNPVGNPTFGGGKQPRTVARGLRKGVTNKYKITDLVAAIKEVEEEEGIELLKHFIRRAFKSDPTLGGLMKKLLPDLKSVESKGDKEAPFRLIVELPGEGKKT